MRVRQISPQGREGLLHLPIGWKRLSQDHHGQLDDNDDGYKDDHSVNGNHLFQVCDHGVGKGEKIVLKQSHKISRIGLINMSPAWVYNQKGLQGPGGQRGWGEPKALTPRIKQCPNIPAIRDGFKYYICWRNRGVPSPPQQTVFEGLHSKESRLSFIVQMHQMIQIVGAWWSFQNKEFMIFENFDLLCLSLWLLWYLLLAYLLHWQSSPLGVQA